MPGSFIEQITLPFLIAGIAVLTIVYGHFELLIAIVPLLIAIAFRLGVNSAIASILLISLSAIALNRLGYTSPIAAPENLLSHLEMVQLFIAALFVASLPAAMAVSDTARYQQHLLAEQNIANEAKRAADRANAAKSDFIATMSHEMRSPLNVIVGFTHLLLQRSEVSDQAKQERYPVAQTDISNSERGTDFSRTAVHHKKGRTLLRPALIVVST